MINSRARNNKGLSYKNAIGFYKKKIPILLPSFLFILVISLNFVPFNNVKVFIERNIYYAFSIISQPMSLLNQGCEKAVLYFNAITKSAEIAEENNILQSKVSQLAYLEKENIELKKFYKSSINNRYEEILAKVMLQSNDGFDKRYVLDVGNDKDIKDGYLVFDSAMSLVGRIIGNYAPFYILERYDNYSFKIPVTFFKEEIHAIAKFNPQNKLFDLLYLSDEDKHNIEDGELVITAGVQEIAPYGIVIGSVVKKGDEIFMKRKSAENSFSFVKIIKPNAK